MKSDDLNQSIPIGYDAQGQPIYSASASSKSSATPQEATTISHVFATQSNIDGQSYDPRARVQHSNEPGVRHISRPVEPDARPISDDLKQRHEESKKQYPFLNLTEGEVVIMNLHRHPIGLALPLMAGGIVILALVGLLVVYPAEPDVYSLPSYGLMTLIVGLVMALAGIGTFISVWIYLQNQFFMTNESVIQEIQYSLFSRHEQTVSLGSIEDASYKKNGILQTLLDYGTIRLSTEGEETTYKFHYVANPRKQVAILNNGVESFKNGRPVELTVDS